MGKITYTYLGTSNKLRIFLVEVTGFLLEPIDIRYCKTEEKKCVSNKIKTGHYVCDSIYCVYIENLETDLVTPESLSLRVSDVRCQSLPHPQPVTRYTAV